MNNNKIDSLYSLIKEQSKIKGRPLKIICDWDEVLQTRLPVIVYEFYKIHINSEPTIQFEEFFQNFWEKAMVTYHDHRHSLQLFKDEDGIYGEINQFIRNNLDEFKKIGKEISQWPKLYDNYPFLFIADELLLCLKEELINLVICTTYKEEREKSGGTGGDPRKKKKFEENFASFSDTTLNVSSCLVKGKKLPLRERWIKENHPDFDIFIDDNPNNIMRTKELFSSEKLYLMPRCGDNNFIKDTNIYYILNNLSQVKTDQLESKQIQLTNYPKNII